MILSNTQKFKAFTESNNSAIIRQQKQIQPYQELPTNST